MGVKRSIMIKNDQEPYLYSDDNVAMAMSVERANKTFLSTPQGNCATVRQEMVGAGGAI